MSFRDHPPDQHRRRNLAKKCMLWAAHPFCYMRRFIDWPFLLAVVIICMLAVVSGYQVRISFLGGFRFEPVQAGPIAPEFSNSAMPQRTFGRSEPQAARGIVN
jgi:hypothetical protein